MSLVLKTLSYGTTHVIVAVAVAYAITGDFIKSLSIGLLEPAVQTIVFAFHEMIWQGTFKQKVSKVLSYIQG